MGIGYRELGISFENLIFYTLIFLNFNKRKRDFFSKKQ